ncbi:MAG: hypothetical protein GX776_00345 [Oxalobacter sp.]|nr:hypothetical protein [Oxalobacter sp.]
MAAGKAGDALPGEYTMMRFSCFCRSVLAVCCCMVFLLPIARAQDNASGKAYTRIYIENRCYHTVDLAIEREKEDVSLPPVSPRDTEIVLFTWTKNIVPEEVIRFSRKDAGEKRVTAEELLAGARQEQWVMGRHVVTSWFVTLCKKERKLDDPAGVTIRPAQAGEKVAEYEMLFTRVPGSGDSMHIFSDYPVRISLNGTPLQILATGKDGVLRFLLLKEASGTITLEAAPDITRTMALGSDWRPVRVRSAKVGEKLLVEPKQVGSPEDW